MNSAGKKGRIQQRKTPRQERSIQRFDAILAAASTLIARGGVSNLKMTELAAEAGVPVGSLYQFFPEKAAILRALHDRHTRRVEEGAKRVFTPLKSVAEAAEMIDFAIDTFYSVFRRDPTYLPMWLASISDPDLQDLNQRHIDRLSDLLHDIFVKLLPPDSKIDIKARLVIFVYLSGSVVRYAMAQNDSMACRILTEWKANMRSTLFAETVTVTTPAAYAPPEGADSSADRS